MMLDILDEDVYNASYGYKRMRDALILKTAQESKNIEIPSKRTVYRIMQKLGISHHPVRKPNGITKADREAQKSDDLLHRDFSADKPCEKCVTDITELKASDGKLYVSAIFDCYDALVAGIAMADHMRAELCAETVKNTVLSHPEMRSAIIHSDRGSQYTSREYRDVLGKYGIRQSMNSSGGRCHDNARCESFWARMKVEIFYSRRIKPENHTICELKEMIWRYFMSYWNNRRICSANGGLPPAVRRRAYYAAKDAAQHAFIPRSA